MIRHRQQQREKFDPDREVEHLCDIGAAELILPEDAFRADLQREGFGLGAVMPLRERYAASREAVVRRMVQLDDGASAAAFLEYRLKPSEVAAARQMGFFRANRPQPKLRIAYAVLSEKFGAFLPQHKSVPDDSCAYRALLSGEVEKARENWSIPGLPTCRVDAMAMPAGDDIDTSLKAVALLCL